MRLESVKPIQYGQKIDKNTEARNEKDAKELQKALFTKRWSIKLYIIYFTLYLYFYFQIFSSLLIYLFLYFSSVCLYKKL